MNKLLFALIFLSIFSCSNKKRSNKNSVTRTIEKKEFLKEKLNFLSETQKIKLTKYEKVITTVALLFHHWYIKNTNEIKSKIPTGFVVAKGENDSCIVDYEPYFKELRKLGTIFRNLYEKRN